MTVQAAQGGVVLIVVALLALVSCAGGAVVAVPPPTAAGSAEGPGQLGRHDGHGSGASLPVEPLAESQSASSSAGPLPVVPLDRGDAGRGGARFAAVGCLGCHTVRGSGGAIGPDLTDVGRRVRSRAAERRLTPDALYFIESLVYPQAYVVEGYLPVMLDWRTLNLTEQDLADLAAYLGTLMGP